MVVAGSRQLRAVHCGRLDSGVEGRVSFRIRASSLSVRLPSAPVQDFGLPLWIIAGPPPRVEQTTGMSWEFWRPVCPSTAP